MILEAPPSRPNAYAALLAMYGDQPAPVPVLLKAIPCPDPFDLLKAHIDAYVSKSYVAAHTRTLPNGQVVQIRGFSNSRGHDVHTPDLFRQHLAAPKMHFTQEQARNPELFTPDLFSGETKASRPKKFQVRDSAGKVIKEFHGEHAERDAKLHILESGGKRLNLKNVTFDD